MYLLSASIILVLIGCLQQAPATNPFKLVDVTDDEISDEVRRRFIGGP